MFGEMTAEEVRTVQAVLRYVQDQMNHGPIEEKSDEEIVAEMKET